MNHERFSRRALLKSLGASAALVPLLHAERAPAATVAGFPKRLVTVSWTNGIVPTDFYPTGADLTIGQTLKPLEAFKAKMLMPIGLDLKVVLDAAGNRAYDGHFTFPSLLTGRAEQKSEGRIGQGISVDQFIANEVSKKVSLTAPLLNLGVRSQGDGNPTSWRAAGQMNVAETDPYRLFTRLFASAAMPPGTIDTLRLRRQSVLDFVVKDLTGFGQRLGTEDRTKIDAHMESIRELERQLSTTVPGAGASCVKPTLPPTGTKLDVPTLMKVMFEMGAVALKCDLTRVITYDLYDDGGGDGNNFPWLGISSDYHKVAHAGSSQYAQKIKIDQWIYQNIAILVQQLDATVESEGTALDHTVVMTCNDMNEGADHYVGRIPFLLIGSCGGFFKTGKVVRYSKIPHNRLLTALCNAMDVPATTFGAAGYEGTLTELST